MSMIGQTLSDPHKLGSRKEPGTGGPTKRKEPGTARPTKRKEPGTAGPTKRKEPGTAGPTKARCGPSSWMNIDGGQLK